jgi:hypothetical protein
MLAIPRKATYGQATLADQRCSNNYALGTLLSGEVELCEISPGIMAEYRYMGDQSWQLEIIKIKGADL